MMRFPPMTNSDEGDIEEDLPDHIRKIQQEHLGQNKKQEINWEFWHFVAIHLFHFKEDDFFENTTLRRLYSLVDQYQKFNEKDS